MEKQIASCPMCKKRACDIRVTNGTENVDFYVELKCPNCRNIVRIQYSHIISLHTLESEYQRKNF